MTKFRVIFGVLLFAVISLGVTAHVQTCDAPDCTILVFKEDAKSDCTNECANACGGEEHVTATPIDLQTSCECRCDEAGGSCMTAATADSDFPEIR